MPGKSRRGNSLVEFTLVGIPLIFMLISIFEMARGMWNYHTLAYAAKQGARFVIVRGKNCSSYGNSCGVTVGQIAHEIANDAIGITPDTFNATLYSQTAAPVECAPLQTCFNNATSWPPAGDNQTGADIRVLLRYPFQSALAMFWPGAGARSFGTFYFTAYSRQTIQF